MELCARCWGCQGDSGMTSSKISLPQNLPEKNIYRESKPKRIENTPNFEHVDHVSWSTLTHCDRLDHVSRIWSAPWPSLAWRPQIQGEDWVHFQSSRGGGIRFHHVNLQYGNLNFLLPNLQKCSSGPGFCSSKLSWRYHLVHHCLAPHSPVPWGVEISWALYFPGGRGPGVGS